MNAAMCMICEGTGVLALRPMDRCFNCEGAGTFSGRTDIYYVTHMVQGATGLESGGIHQVRLPIGAAGWYTQAVSIDAFRSRETKRLVKNQHGPWVRKPAPIPFYYSVRSRFDYEHDWEFNRNMSAKALKKNDLPLADLYRSFYIEKIPTKTHASVWDFYTAIGYDHKRNKFKP